MDYLWLIYGLSMAYPRTRHLFLIDPVPLHFFFIARPLKKQFEKASIKNLNSF